jgi:putative ABC transport system permease protein
MDESRDTYPGQRRGARFLASMLAESLGTLAEHRLRTALALGAFAASVAVVTVMIGVASAAERRVLQRVRAMGTDLVQVLAAPAPRVVGRQQQVAIMTNLRIDDAEALMAEIPGARAAAVVTQSMAVRALGRNTTSLVMGTTPVGLVLRDIRIEAGRPFDESEERELRRVALLGPTVARIIFGADDPVGQEVRLGNVPFDVIGVIRRRGTDVGGTDLDNSVLVPLGTAMRRLLQIPYVHAIAIKQTDMDLFRLEAEVRAVLEQRHRVRSGSPPPFVIQNQAVLLRTERGATSTFDRLTRGIGALTALSGVAGILVVMLLAERERRREIGVRRAVGARRSDVAWQFLVESSVLAAVGSAAGVVLGGVAIVIAGLTGAWDPVFPVRAGLVAVAAALFLGGVAGLYPAIRAARVDPVRALMAE